MPLVSPNILPNCPNCGRTFQPGRLRCQWCGADLSQVPLPDMELLCPCCEESQLEEFHKSEWILHFCGRCGGLWMTSPMLERLERHYEKPSAPAQPVLAKTQPETPTPTPDLNGPAPGVEDSGDAPADTSGAPLETPPAPAEPQSGLLYRRCPQCRKMMSRRCYHRVSHVVIDECMGHGVWFDRQEFDRVLAFLRAGGLGQSKTFEADHPLRELHDLFRIF